MLPPVLTAASPASLAHAASSSSFHAQATISAGPLAYISFARLSYRLAAACPRLAYLPSSVLFTLLYPALLFPPYLALLFPSSVPHPRSLSSVHGALSGYALLARLSDIAYNFVLSQISHKSSSLEQRNEPALSAFVPTMMLFLCFHPLNLIAGNYTLLTIASFAP
jgi:hypothetical protein